MQTKLFRKSLIIGVILCLLPFSMLLFSAQSSTSLDEVKITRALKQNYGERAAKRGRAWFSVMARSKHLENIEKLKNINQFFNLLYFVDDIKLWGKSNYWATPIEFLGVNGGDCEDFAIAKYFSLLAIGIPDEKMRITMVKALRLDQYHMVVSYYETPGSIPLILDNLDGRIKKANLRKDLIPIYSFNGKQLWLNKEKGRGVLVGKSQRLKLWKKFESTNGAFKNETA